MSKHTPGPWMTQDNGLTVFHDRNTDPQMLPSLQVIAEVKTTCQFDEEARANALLIASSPDLLEALTSLFEDWTTLVGEDLREDNADVNKIWKQAEAAIAKAKGSP